MISISELVKICRKSLENVMVAMISNILTEFKSDIHISVKRRSKFRVNRILICQIFLTFTNIFTKNISSDK